MSRQAEIWLLEGTGYKLPLLVAHNGDICAARPADVNFLQKQKAIACAALEAIATGRNGSTFFVPTIKLSAIARVVGIEGDVDPEDLLSWTPYAADAPPPLENPEAFYESFYQKCAGPIKSPDHAKLLWLWFCLHSMDWLLNKQKPLDLYFCKLHPFPYRADWKNVVYHYDAITPANISRGRKMRFCRFIPDMFRRVGEWFFSGDSIAVNDDGTIEWTLDIELQDPFIHHARELEAKRMALRPGHEYWDGVMDCLKRRCLDAMKLYADWLGKIRKPKLGIPLLWDDFGCAFDTSKVHRKPPQPSALSVVHNKQEIGPRQPENLDAEDRSMLPLPHIQSVKAHVRDSRTKDGPPANG